MRRRTREPQEPTAAVSGVKPLRNLDRPIVDVVLARNTSLQITLNIEVSGEEMFYDRTDTIDRMAARAAELIREQLSKVSSGVPPERSP